MGAIAFVRRTPGVALFVARLAGALVPMPKRVPAAVRPVPNPPAARG